MSSIKIEFNKFTLPCVVKSDNAYYIQLENVLNEYLENIKDIDEKCFENTKDNVNLILECLNLYNNAKISEAKLCIESIIKKYINNPLIVSKIDENYAFRGLAPVRIRPESLENKYDTEYNYSATCC